MASFDLIDKVWTMQAVYSGDGQMREASIVEILQDGEVSLRFKGVKVCIFIFIIQNIFLYFVKQIFFKLNVLSLKKSFLHTVHFRMS